MQVEHQVQFNSTQLGVAVMVNSVKKSETDLKEVWTVVWSRRETGAHQTFSNGVPSMCFLQIKWELTESNFWRHAFIQFGLAD